MDIRADKNLTNNNNNDPRIAPVFLCPESCRCKRGLLVYREGKMNIMEAIEKSKLGKYQKEIDRCNSKKGCNTCIVEEQGNCIKLKNHSDEVAGLKYD